MVIIASFQKSGNTWLNFILANIYNLIENNFHEIDFHNIHGIIPEFRKCEKSGPFFVRMPKVLRTHLHYQDDFDRVIMLLRNPYDVLYSYLHYLNGEKKLKLSLSELIKHDRYGIKPFVEFTNSYTRNCQDLLIVTYERLHSNPGKEVGKIISYIGLETDNSIIRRAIRLSEFKKMRKTEVKKGRKYGTPGFMFTRSGKIGEGVRIIKTEPGMEKYILDEMKKSPVLYFLYG